MDGWTERENGVGGGRRGLILPGLWNKLVLERRRRERDRKSIYPFIHAFPSLFALRPSRSVSSAEESMRSASRSGTEHT